MKSLRLARWLLERTLPYGTDGETILGDLLEELHRRGDAPAARRWFWRQTIALAPRYFWRRGRDSRPFRNPTPERPPMPLEGLRQDIRFALRSWRRSPAFTAIVVGTLALGIGASTAIFSLVDGIVLRPLPYADPDRLVYLNEVDPGGDQMSVSWPDFLDWRARQSSFEELALSRGESFTLTGVERAERLRARRVTANLFGLLGVSPEVGAGFSDGDDRAGAAARVLLGHAFWNRRFGGDANVVGRALTLDGQSHLIAGVLPRDFRYLGRDYDLFVPMGPIADNEYLRMRGNHQGYHAVGRLRDGVTLATAAAEMRSIAAGIEQEHPDTNSGLGVTATPLRDRLVADVRPTLLLLLGAVGFLLAIACVNVANLLVARGAARRRELGLRAALGSGRRRLIAQLLVESSLISAAGAIVGTALAQGLLVLLVAVAPEGTPRLAEVRLDGGALLFALAAAAISGLVFGAFPAFQASSARGQHALARTRSAGASAATHRLRRGLMVVEVALALVLLVGAGLMVRTLGELTAVDAGFRSARLVTARFTLAGERWSESAARSQMFDQLLGRLRTNPLFEKVALADSLPIEGANWTSIFLARDRPEPPRAAMPSASFLPVSPGYFETLDTRLASGREFDGTDGATSPPTAIVNEALARRIWPGEDPIGKMLKQGWPESPTPWRQVVGVVADVKFDGVAEPVPLQVYLPLAQEPTDAPAILVRTSASLATVRAVIAEAVEAFDKDSPLYAVSAMDDLLGGAIARQRMAMLVLAVFASVALLLAAIGLYGVVAHGVTERTHEIGVRMALGAERSHVIGLVVRQGLTTALVGTAIGLVAAFALARSIRSLLFGVTATDPSTLVGVVATLLVVTAAACYLPARRAARVDPIQALRVE